jgi:twitching motility protein PilT
MAQKITMQQLLYNMRKTEASDLHLKVGLPPIYRIAGDLRSPPGLSQLTGEDTERLMGEIMTPALMQRFVDKGDVDFSTFLFTTPAGPDGTRPPEDRPDRFRCNAFRAGGAMHAAIRRVKPEIPTFESLHLPDVYRRIADEYYEGLVLVVGVTGSGKSTTLACMLERINKTRSENIITVEDPVEYQLHSQKSVVSQRELGTDVPSYAEALRYIVRQDPDVIFIGELRDHDTVLAAIQAAETGHLVFGSLHAADTMQCFSRIVEFFPQHEHQFIRSALASSMKAVCAQRLLPANKDVAGVGVVPATEVLLTNGTVKEKIREAEDTDLPAIVNSSLVDGMRSFTHSLAELVESEMVNLHTALEFAPNKEALSSRLKGVEVKAATLVGKIRGGGH